MTIKESNFFGYGKPGSTSKWQDWETPQQFFDELNNEFNFNWDLAASNENHKVDNYFTEEDDSLSKNWGGAVATYF